MEIDEGKRRSLKMVIKVLDKRKRGDKEEAEDKLNLEATEKEKRKKKADRKKTQKEKKKVALPQFFSEIDPKFHDLVDKHIYKYP